MAEVSKIGSYRRGLVVVTSGWQSEPAHAATRGWGSGSLSLCLSPVRLFATVIIFLYLSACLLVHPFLWWSISFSVCLCLYLSLYLSIHPSIGLSCCPSISPCIYLSIFLPCHLWIQPSIFLSIHLNIHRSVRLFMYQSKRPSIHPCIHVSSTLFVLEPLRSSDNFYLFAHLDLLSPDSFSSLTLPTSALPSVHIVESLTSKRPSMIIMYDCHVWFM